MEIPEEDLPPPLLEECEFVYRAFWELSTDRQVGMGLGGIPWSSINAYAERYGIASIDDFDHFASLIRATDAAYLDAANQKT